MKACLHSSDLGQNLPSCAAIKCLKPPLPPFVTINPDKQEYAYNETVTFGCPTGYSLNGEMVKDCLHSADLTQNLPSCAAITCGRPELSYPLHISANSYKTSYNYNDSIEFTCSLGFTIQNPSVKYCTYTDAFQHNLPGCKEVKCSLPTFQQKEILLINPNETLHDFNSSVHFTCKDGFYLNGPQSVSCQQNGSFGLIGNLPSCSVSQIRCQAPLFSDNLHISTDKQIYNYSETIRFSCSEGFFLQGTSERTCKRNGALQPPFPNCTDITCQRPILSIRGSLQLSTNPLQQTFSYNESISFFCISGYILHGPTVKYCRKNGDFEQGLPFCTAKAIYKCQISWVLALSKQESPSFTVGFFSGGAVGIVVISSVIIVIFLLRRRLRQQKKQENTWYKGGNHQTDDKDHEYSGIEYQSSDREDHNPNVLEPQVSVSDGHYTETQFDSDDKDHQYTELNEIKMNQLTEATADRSVQL